MPITGPSGDFLTWMERIGISLVIGGLIGLEREWAHKDVGVRTFAFVALVFMLAWTVSPVATYLLFAALIPLITLLNWRSFARDRSLELTTSVALLATALLGILAAGGRDMQLVALACAVVITGLLAWKSEVVRFAGEVTIDEIRGALLLGVIGLVVYPILPRGTIDPWHLIDLRAAWTVVLVISGIAFTNYVLLRLYGTRGIRWTGLLGGLVNSTATVAELAGRARSHPGRLSEFVLTGILTANTAMLLRNGLILGVFNTAALSYGWVAVAFMLAASALITYFIRAKDTETAPLHMRSPISFRTALTFGAFFLLIALTAELANRTLGPGGFLLVAAIGGLVSSASTSAAAGILAAKGVLSPELAGYGVVITSMASLAFHVPVAQMAGRNRSMTLRLAIYSGVILAAGLAGLGTQRLLDGHL